MLPNRRNHINQNHGKTRSVFSENRLPLHGNYTGKNFLFYRKPGAARSVHRLTPSGRHDPNGAKRMSFARSGDATGWITAVGGHFFQAARGKQGEPTTKNEGKRRALK